MPTPCVSCFNREECGIDEPKWRYPGQFSCYIPRDGKVWIVTHSDEIHQAMVISNRWDDRQPIYKVRLIPTGEIEEHGTVFLTKNAAKSALTKYLDDEIDELKSRKRDLIRFR